jgi:hypothetical protein
MVVASGMDVWRAEVWSVSQSVSSKRLEREGLWEEWLVDSSSGDVGERLSSQLALH